MSAGESERERLLNQLAATRNWGRWGDDDQRGTVNLITTEKRCEAAALVRSGVSVSLTRPLPRDPGPNNPRPALHYMERRARPGGSGAGVAADFIGVTPHGVACTHVDALCHVWDKDGMWNGRDPDEHIGFHGASWGGIQHWKEGIVTRGVLLDVPRYRQTSYVGLDQPVEGTELRAIAAAQNVEIRPGDAVVVHCGREAWDRSEPVYGSGGAALQGAPTGAEGRPGLDISCLEPLRTWDAAMLVWDMLDATPNEHGLPFTVHAGIFSYGLALLDSARIEPLVEACTAQETFEFMLVVAPLWIEGGTGSPVNPIAIL